MVPKFLTSQELPKAGPTSLRRHSLGVTLEPASCFRDSWDEPRPDIRGSNGVCWSSVTTHHKRKVTSKPTSHVAGWERQMAFQHFGEGGVIPISKTNARHGRDIKAGDPAAAATGVTRLNSKHSFISFMHKLEIVSAFQGLPFSFSQLSNDIQTYINVFQLAPTSCSLFSPSLPCILPSRNLFCKEPYSKYFRP